MNGALTIGTLDGANVEIRDAVGHESFFLFGLTADEVGTLRASGYRPRSLYESNSDRVSDAYNDRNAWTRMSILNTTRVGRFSSDRSIREYCRDIWNVSPQPPGEDV